MTAGCSRGSSTGTGAGCRGVMCRASSGRGRRCGSGTAATAATAPGTTFSLRLLVDADAAGVDRLGGQRGLHDHSRPPARRPTSPATQGAGSNYTNPRARAARPCDRPVPRRAVDEDPPARRRARPAAGGAGRPGQAGDSPMFAHLMAHLRIARLGPGRPRTRPDACRGDKAYSSRAIRRHLREPRDRRGHPRTLRPARPPQTTRLPRRAAARVRPRGLQATATSSNAASTTSSSGAGSPPATTNSRSPTAAAAVLNGNRPWAPTL